MTEGSPQMMKAVGILKELSADEQTRMLYENREKARRDIDSMVGGARREGMAEGLAEGIILGRVEGITLGRDEGRVEERTTIARSLLALDASLDIIIKSTGLSREEIERLH